MEGNLSIGIQKSPKIISQKKQKLEGEFELGRAGAGSGGGQGSPSDKSFSALTQKFQIPGIWPQMNSHMSKEMGGQASS